MKYLVMTLLAMPLVASAAQWVNVASAAGTTMQVDRQSLVVQRNGERKIWVDYLYDQPQDGGAGKQYSRVVMLHLYRCSERSSAVLQEVYYDSKDAGAVVGSFKYPPERRSYSEVVPESFNESALDFVCGLPTPKR